MKQLKIFHVNDIDLNNLEQLHSILDEHEKHVLQFHLWAKANEGKPVVRFSLAYDNGSVFVKFFVEENEIRANVTKTNGEVWKDSCVEFFLSFDDLGYYNLEFNCIGTVLAAFGNNRYNRAFLPERLLKEIGTSTKITKTKDRFYWEILIVIPIELFVHHKLSSLTGIVCKANFYKCGDGLSVPHYLSWSNIESETPDFHLPQFFGEVVFK